MASFVPLNVYPDSDSEGEVDNTEEIQIEEALKLYQRALKLHTDGAWEEARKAYADLFASELFQVDTDLEEQVHGRNRTAASSLPLVHYLAYKNHGSFKLDNLRASLSNKADVSTPSEDEIRSAILQALDWFATALGRDSGDPSLWRQTAHLSLVIRSARLARFSLESILDHDTIGDEPSKDSLALVVSSGQNPEEAFALYQLKDIMYKISDALTLSTDQFQKLSKKKLNAKFSKFLNPYSWLPVPSAERAFNLKTILDDAAQNKETIQLNTRTWAAVGKAIISVLEKEGENKEGEAIALKSNVLQIILPTYEGEEESRDTTPDDPVPSDAIVRAETAITDDNEDVTMTDASATTAVGPDRQRSGSSSRKRKSTSMGVDGVDAGRSRLSKRQRDKKEADAAAAAAAAAAPESKQKLRQETQDEKLFNTAFECFSPFGVNLGTAATLKVNTPETTNGETEAESLIQKDDLYLYDFKKILQSWDDDMGNVIIYGDGIQSTTEAAQGMAFLDLEASGPSRSVLGGDLGLRKWAKGIHERQLCAEEAGFEWLRALCMRDYTGNNGKKSKGIVGTGGQSTWVQYNWPDSLKAIVLTAANVFQEICWQFFKDFENRSAQQHLEKQYEKHREENYAIIEWAETMLEIYLEDLTIAERDRSGADVSLDLEERLAVKRVRVQRWGHLVGDLMHQRSRGSDGQLEEDQLTLRYLWATAVSIGFGDASREFRVECFEDLKRLLLNRDSPDIELPNSTVMPEMSANRAEREISKLKTVDFFTTVFQAATDTNEKEPGEVIDILEAVLDPTAVLPYDEEEERMLQEIGRFLDGSSAMFKYNLWEKLKNAYHEVGYTPKVFSCTLKCMQVIMSDLKSRNYVESSEDHRQFVLLRSLRHVEELLLDSILLATGAIRNLEEIEDNQLVDAMSTATSLLRLLHCYAFWEDAVMNTEVIASDLHSYRLVVVKFREMLVRTWVLVYLLYSEALKRGMGAPQESAWEDGQREERLAALLKDIHEELGVRHYCKLADHLFLKVMFDELLRFNLPQFAPDLLQCIHCRYHLMLCSDQWYFYEHKTDAEPLDKTTALSLLDFILEQASKKKILQLAKSDLKLGLDKLVEVLGVPGRQGSSIRVYHNESTIDHYLKSSLHPLKLFGCLKGEVSLSTIAVDDIYARIAAKGLYALQGKIALFPLRYQKKTGMLRGDELGTALSFLKYDLTCNSDNWETWYRLGQTFEIQMDEGQTWSADGINVRRSELVVLERRTVLCYMMAASLAARDPPIGEEEQNKLSNLYTDFGYRIYSASRPPMAMESFWVDGFERHYSGRNGEGMYKARPHAELSLPSALKLALVLFQAAIKTGDGSELWKNHYMVGKCMGKLFDGDQNFSPKDILQKYIDALQLCPEKNINEYVYEPHHKLVSAACKFVLSGALEPAEACEIVQASHFSKRVEPAEDRTGYIKYTIEVFKKMRAADKSKWHHRMTFRTAWLKYHELHDVVGARQEMSNLFSNKAAQLSIWKPDFERPGRHYVFASHYTMLYVDLLEKLQDRATLEILARRVRRLSNGLFQHQAVWSHVFMVYLKVLRDTGNIPQDHEENVFKNISFDEFTTNSHRLEVYCCTRNPQSITLEYLKEIYELRRLNAGLAKPQAPVCDDLLADTYAKLYAELTPEITKSVADDRPNPMSMRNLIFENQTVESGMPTTLTSGPVKMEDLPMRGKLTKVTRRELVSKATNMCKELTQSVVRPAAILPSTGPPSPRQRVTGPNSPTDTTMTGDGGGLVEQGDGSADDEPEGDGTEVTNLPPNISIEE